MLHKNIPISQTKSYFENPSYLLEEPVLFLLSKKNPFPVLTILTGKDWCFTHFSTGMTGWMLLIFFICLHNQLNSIHSIISIDVWKMWFIKQKVKMDGYSFQQVYDKIWISFCLKTGKRFFLEVHFQANRKSIGSSKKLY